MCRHWMVFVNWGTVVGWKRSMRDAVAHGGVYPYQYSSDNVRFLQIKPGDVLWVVSTPRFDARGKPSMRGRARPPAVMARLRIQRMCCNHTNELRRIEVESKKPVCLGGALPSCDDPAVLHEGVHPASDAWSIVAIGEKDPEKDPTPLQTTYPMLYNFFGILPRLKFETKHGETNLSEYLAFVAGGEYLSTAQREAKRAGKAVRDPGPYAALGQYLLTPRKLTPEAAQAMDLFHDRAVSGKRVFFSYKWADAERFAQNSGQSRMEWVRALNCKLDEVGYNSWLDHHQILADRDIGGLLEEVLSDAVQQSVMFVTLLSENYGTGWTLEEWNRAQEQLANPKRKDKLLVIVLDCGGDPGRLGLTSNETQSISRSPTPDDVVQAITQGIALRAVHQ